MGVDADNWNAKFREVLIGRSVKNLSKPQIDTKLGEMDTHWSNMSAGEKTTAVNKMGQMNATGARTRLILNEDEPPHFPRKIAVKAVFLDDLVTRFTS